MSDQESEPSALMQRIVFVGIAVWGALLFYLSRGAT
jgi:hypothetical protein